MYHIRYIVAFLILRGIVMELQAGELRTPPPLLGEPVEEQTYFRDIWRNWNNLKIITTNPNGSDEGQKGDMVFFDTATDKICINVDGSTAWRCANLTAP